LYSDSGLVFLQSDNSGMLPFPPEDGNPLNN
jgi:hypothetical protein